MVEQLKEKIMQGGKLERAEALSLVTAPLEELCQSADALRRHFCGNTFDICTIINGKSGKCSEDCKYCAQSAYYDTAVETYPLLEQEKIVAEARYNEAQGMLRYSIVTAGRNLDDSEIAKMCETARAIVAGGKIRVCCSFGLLNEAQYRQLHAAGIERVHNNLETSRRFFPQVCTTHSFDDKIAAIKAAQRAGMTVCSGGIMGLGETMEDRIDMALTLRELGIRSVPLNMLNPIQHTPYAQNQRLTIEEMSRIVAIFRFLLPDASIRLAGGRGLMADKGEKCFRSGANAAISGDMLTTAGISCATDLALIDKLGFKAGLWNE